MNESYVRSWIKALSWRVSGSLITMLVVYIITGKPNFALSVGSIEFVGKIVFYYIHERIWALIPFGVTKVWHEKIS